MTWTEATPRARGVAAVLRGVLSAALMFTLSGCSGGSQDASIAPAVLPEAFADVAKVDKVRSLSHLDFDILESPIEVAQVSEVALTGKVVRVLDGPRFYADGYTDYYQYIEVRPADTYKDDTDSDEGDVFVRIYAGSQDTDVNGQPLPAPDGVTYTKLTAAELAEAFPAGTKITVMGRETTAESPTAGATTVDAGQSLPAGSLLIAADPQGLLLEGPDHTLINAGAEQEVVEGDDWASGDGAFTQTMDELENATERELASE